MLRYSQHSSASKNHLIMFRGERVMGLVAGGALGTTVEADPALLWPVPEHWSLEDAATVPLPFIHAYYILVRIA